MQRQTNDSQSVSGRRAFLKSAGVAAAGLCLADINSLGHAQDVPTTAKPETLALDGGKLAGAPIKIYIVTDLEGASGVYSFEQAREPGTPLNQKAREYLMGDLAAVIRGLRDAGAGEILVLDGHGSGSFIPDLMESGAKYITGQHPPGCPLWGLDKTYSGLIIVGQHAMMGTPDGVLCHTQSSKSENRYWYNDVESGELAQCAACAGHFNVPLIMVTGDEATCRETKHFVGDDCVSVAVKNGIAREGAMLYPFGDTRKALYEGAKRAVAVIPRCKPYRLALPIKAKKQFLVFDKDGKSHIETKEGTIPDALHIYDF